MAKIEFEVSLNFDFDSEELAAEFDKVIGCTDPAERTDCIAQKVQELLRIEWTTWRHIELNKRPDPNLNVQANDPDG